MSDWLYFPGVRTASNARGTPSTIAPVRIWLLAVAALVFVMVVVGGATRLTGSGLSITQWKPLTGVLPPLSAAAWEAEFELYRQIPQYSQLFPDMTLDGFRFIYFWEWGHRLLGRVIGLAFGVPLLFFWLRGYLSRGLALKLLGVLFLGALQGGVGWWMVKSGLSERVDVSQYRLAAHLLMASLTFSLLLGLAIGLEKNATRPARAFASTGPKRASSTLITLFAVMVIALVFLQIGMGGLVAGLKAGLTYNSWPLMDGHFIPPWVNLTRLSPLWTNLFENVTTVQFLHRMTAYGLLLAALVNLATCAMQGNGATLHRAMALAGMVLLQAGVGIVTLLLAVPLWAGLLHQACAMVVLALAIWHWQCAQPAKASS